MTCGWLLLMPPASTTRPSRPVMARRPSRPAARAGTRPPRRVEEVFRVLTAT